MQVISASYLYAPDKHVRGEHRCFFCGIDCDDSHSVKDNVKKTFTNFDEVLCPGSKFICGCCIASMSGLADTKDIGGETRTGRSGAPRMYSWLLSKNCRMAFNKKYMDFARRSVLNPPEPPFSIILADSGHPEHVRDKLTDKAWFSAWRKIGLRFGGRHVS